MDWTLLGAVGATGSGFVLLNAGWWKLRHRPAFALVLSEHGRVVAANVGWLAWALPVAELALGLGSMTVVLPPSTRAVLVLPPTWLPMLGMVVLGGIFAGYAGVQLRRGVRPRCGCLDSQDRFGAHTVLRALAISLGGLGGLAGRLTGAGGTGPLPPYVWAMTVVAGGLMVAVVLLVGLPLIANPGGPAAGISADGDSADGDRRLPRGHQLADHRRTRHLTGDQQPP
ncbi:MauE/DoxX family redox-associated membrane protein [Streptomyces sp. NPDC004647]|uniref:MauE/DoxX family redox-associated membrane protein n=1 Tax=Streptomyces sp. NPDC004647 TaxID=3154671 RepID=UPI0033BCAC3E